MVNATMQNNNNNDDDEMDQEEMSCTSSTPNEDNKYYRATKTPESERKLASTLGYPQTWHVVRIVPHPCNSSNSNSCMDTIYTSSPDSGCDVYYNHNSALKAAMNWIPGESTGYEQKGGQMLPRQQLFKKGDLVQVLYSEDDKWYDATVEKVKEYLNDIRYTVHYTDEDATQSNVSEELLRKAPPKATKKRKYQKKTKKAAPPIETKKKVNKKKQTKITFKKPPPPKNKKKKGQPKTPKKKKQKIAEDNSSRSSNEDDSSSSEHNEKSDKMVKYLSQFSLQEIQKRIKFAIGLGLPEGWVAASLSNSRFDIVNPEGVRFKTKKSAFESLQPQNENDVLSFNEEEKDEPSDESSSSFDHGTDTEQEEEEEEEMDQTDHDDTVDSKPPPSQKKKKKQPTPKKKKPTPKKSATPKRKTPIPPLPPPQIEEGDPPWRTTGHEYIGRKIIYKHTPSSSSKTMTQQGIVKGWIDSTDVDSNGDAAFLSEKSGDPAMLFHVRFDLSNNNKKGTGNKWKGGDDLLFVDMEEYELLDCLVEKKDDESESESESEEDSEEDDNEEVNW